MSDVASSAKARGQILERPAEDLDVLRVEKVHCEGGLLGLVQYGPTEVGMP